MVIVLVRHAEREATGTNPGLTAAGRARARLLADMLGDAGVEAIFTSRFRRTQETAAPLAADLQITPIELDDDIDAAEQQVRAAGQVVLVVGHSDTVPAVIGALDGPVVSIDDGEFNRMFVLHVGPGASQLLSMKYGAM
jgi:broad specificity phosphatase PhoE